MKWIQILLIPFLSLHLPLFQTDQGIGVGGFVGEGAVLTKLEKEDSSTDPDLWSDLRISSHSCSRVKSFFSTEEPFFFLAFTPSGGVSFLETPARALTVCSIFGLGKGGLLSLGHDLS